MGQFPFLNFVFSTVKNYPVTIKLHVHVYINVCTRGWSCWSTGWGNYDHSWTSSDDDCFFVRLLMLFLLGASLRPLYSCSLILRTGRGLMTCGPLDKEEESNEDGKYKRERDLKKWDEEELNLKEIQALPVLPVSSI